MIEVDDEVVITAVAVDDDTAVTEAVVPSTIGPPGVSAPAEQPTVLVVTEEVSAQEDVGAEIAEVDVSQKPKLFEKTLTEEEEETHLS